MGPGLGVLACPGAALLAYAIVITESRRRALLGYLAASAVQHVLWFWWAFPMALALSAERPLPVQLLIGAGMVIVVGLPATTLVSVGIVFARRRLPVCTWFPIAWAVGERFAVRWTSVVDDWVSTQVEISAVMRLVHWVGAVPALLACLTAATALGEGLAKRRPLYALPVVGCLFLFALAPRLEKADPALLEGVGVTHLRSRLELPSLEGLSPAPELVVWPEQIIAGHSRLDEGPTLRAATLPPFYGTGIEHIVGAVTASSVGSQNTLLHVTPQGSIRRRRRSPEGRSVPRAHAPPCWPGASVVRSETQIAMHEIAEGIDLAIGHQGCVANGRCEGGAKCDRPCDGFTGLFCEGAPEETPTGCGAQRVRGWAVQRLAHKGWDTDECPDCAECDFTVEGKLEQD